jgi:hypothetical protein
MVITFDELYEFSVTHFDIKPEWFNLILILKDSDGRDQQWVPFRKSQKTFIIEEILWRVSVNTMINFNATPHSFTYEEVKQWKRNDKIKKLFSV